MDRNDEMVLLRFRNGWTLQNIAEKFGVSRERVRQIVGNSGKDFRKKRTLKILENYDVNPDQTTSDIFDSISATTHNLVMSFVKEKIARSHHLPDGAAYNRNGVEAENRVSIILAQNGITNQLMPSGYPFDIQTHDGIKIDVKCCISPWWGPRSKTPFYKFSIKKDIKSDTDFFIFTVKDKKDIWIVPFAKLPKVRDVYISTNINDRSWGSSKRWNEWVNRFDLLRRP